MACWPSFFIPILLKIRISRILCTIRKQQEETIKVHIYLRLNNIIQRMFDRALIKLWLSCCPFESANNKNLLKPSTFRCKNITKLISNGIFLKVGQFFLHHQTVICLERLEVKAWGRGAGLHVAGENVGGRSKEGDPSDGKITRLV